MLDIATTGLYRCRCLNGQYRYHQSPGRIINIIDCPAGGQLHTPRHMPNNASTHNTKPQNIRNRQISADPYRTTAYHKQPPYSVLDTIGSEQLITNCQVKRQIPNSIINHCQGKTASPNSVMKNCQGKTAIPIPNLSISIPALISQSKARQ